MKPYLDIMEHFGYRAQMKKLAEESYEFLEAVDNYEDLLLFGVNNYHEEMLARDFVVEEMADMLILLTQFVAKYEITQNELNAHIDDRIIKTLKQIGDGYYDEGNDVQESHSRGK